MKAKVRTGPIAILRKGHVHKTKQKSNKQIIREELKQL